MLWQTLPGAELFWNPFSRLPDRHIFGACLSAKGVCNQKRLLFSSAWWKVGSSLPGRAGIWLKPCVLSVSALALVSWATPHTSSLGFSCGLLAAGICLLSSPWWCFAVQPAVGAGGMQAAWPAGIWACCKWLSTLPLWTAHLAGTQKSDGKGMLVLICRIPRKGCSSGD